MTPAVTAFRGAPPEGREPSRAGLPPAPPPAPPSSPAPAVPLLNPIAARAIAFVALAVFGGQHWMRMVEPAAPARAWYALAAGVVVAAGLLLAGRLHRWLRAAVAGAAVLAGCAIAVVGAGAGDELLAPAHWDELVGGVGRGIASLPGARVPYRGLDDWLRLVIPLGGTLLTVVAAALAFWPRRSGTGFPGAALVALVALYAVPAVALIFDSEFVRGALLALLVVGFLRLERLRRHEAPAASLVATVTVVLGLMVAPALDGIEPWWDYETWAMSSAGSKSTTFSWDHDYGPLRWPRDGRELLRVKSKARTYWKADQLDLFDGERWQQTQDAGALREAPGHLTEGIEFRRLERWTFDITVSVRNLRSETFVAAGTLVEKGVQMPRRAEIPTERAGVYRTTRTLRRGDVYTARVYVPQPEEDQLRRAGSTNYSAYELDRYTQLMVDPNDGGGLTQLDRVSLSFPAFKGDPEATDAGEAGDPELLLRSSDLGRAWALAQRLRAGAGSPYEYVEAIQRQLSRGYGYAEEPPPGSDSLDGFLFDTKVGYCQQFSGAMALLLRMGGVPARVATGFSPGSYDDDTKEYIVRDFDAHSWVEVWFGGIGWVPFDPTPTSAPPRSQADDRQSPSAAIGDIRDLGTATFDPRRDGNIDEPRPWGPYAGAAAAALALLLGLRAWWRRRRRVRPPAGLELERALRIVEGPTRGVTLSALEARFAASPPAAAYVRALRAQRYAVAADGPTPAQRRALRRALARGRGVGGRLRAWWALPPRLPRSG